jgi:WD40 repeat protein
MSGPLFTDYYSNVLRNEQVNASAISPDGSMLAIAHSNGEIFILSPEHKASLFRWIVFNSKTGDEEPVYSLSWCPDPSIDHQDWKLIGACHDGGIIEWKPKLGDKCERRYLTKGN